MPFWKELLEKRFWIGVLLLLMTMVAVNALGAVVLCHGWLPMLYAKPWILASWLIGGFVAGRFTLHAERGQPLARAAMTCAVGYILAWGIGLGFSQGGCSSENWWQVAVALAVAALVAALVGPGRKKKHRKKGKRTVGKTR